MIKEIILTRKDIQEEYLHVLNIELQCYHFKLQQREINYARLIIFVDGGNSYVFKNKERSVEPVNIKKPVEYAKINFVYSVIDEQVIMLCHLFNKNIDKWNIPIAYMYEDLIKPHNFKRMSEYSQGILNAIGEHYQTQRKVQNVVFKSEIERLKKNNF